MKKRKRKHMGFFFFVLFFVVAGAEVYIAVDVDEACDWAETYVKHWLVHGEPECYTYSDGTSECAQTDSFFIDTSPLSSIDRMKMCRYVLQIPHVSHLSVYTTTRKSSFGPTSCTFLNHEYPVAWFMTMK